MKGQKIGAPEDNLRAMLWFIGTICITLGVGLGVMFLLLMLVGIKL